MAVVGVCTSLVARGFGQLWFKAQLLGFSCSLVVRVTIYLYSSILWDYTGPNGMDNFDPNYAQNGPLQP